MNNVTFEQYEIAASNGISRKTLDARIYGYDWNIDDAITEKPMRKTTTKWREIAEEHGVPVSTYRTRIYNLGWTRRRAALTPVREKATNHINLSELEVLT
ncbi:hypothetical protein [Virgibacillus sp. CBA3643]|uniref:hypothetical protein n=1 Tax=Virgibacillus sp. CBA3643 TaxID=2942278 RepID=UPI0035A39B89